MKNNIALLVEPDIEYPILLPNTGMNLGLLRIAGAIRHNCPNIKPLFWSEQIYKAAKQTANMQVDSFLDLLKKWSPKYCFISALTCQIESAIKLCNTAHENGVEVVVLGGVFATLVGPFSGSSLNEFDYIVSGAGESACVEIIKATENNSILNKLICTTRQGAIPEDIFSINPDFSIFMHEIAIPLGIPAVMELSRGCYNHCNFCTLVEKSRGVIFEDPEKVAIQESTFLELGYKQVIICDDTFLCNKKMSLPQLEKMRTKSDSGLSKIILTRVDLITPEMLDLYQKYNITEVILGVEHIDSIMLKNMNKTNSPNEWESKVIDSLSLLSQRNIISHPIYMLGGVGETQKTLINLVDFAIKHGQKENIQPFVSFCTPHPRSYLWNNRKRLGIELFPVSLSSYTHLSPVAFPISLGNADQALEQLVNAHNTIRKETNGYNRNPLINLDTPHISGSMEKLLSFVGE